jgi:hypothetical protein
MSDETFPLSSERNSALLPERRVRVRYSSNLMTLCQKDAAQVDDFWWTARVRDISSSGVSLLSNRPFELETLLVIEPVLPPRELTRSLPPARVVRQCEHGEGGWILGCQFTSNLSEEELRALLPDF